MLARDIDLFGFFAIHPVESARLMIRFTVERYRFHVAAVSLFGLRWHNCVASVGLPKSALVRANCASTKDGAPVFDVSYLGAVVALALACPEKENAPLFKAVLRRVTQVMDAP